jgi:SAM-dependent methyltransferase
MFDSSGYDDSPIIAEMYDRTPPYTQRTDVDFFVEAARGYGERVLELGCGTGRVLIPTARGGMTVTGVDGSEHMLAQCRVNVEAEPTDVRERIALVEAKMTDFNVAGSFDVVTMPFRPIQHLITVEEQLTALRLANRHLRVGGGFVFDVFNPDPVKLRGDAPTEETVNVPEIPLGDGRRYKRTHRVTAFRPEEQINDVELIYYITQTDGTVDRHVQAFPMRYFWRYEIEHLLARTGFEVVALYGDYNHSPYSEHSSDMIWIAEKTAEV